MEINVQLHNEFNVKQEYIDNIINFLDSGCTVPFIARYRKEYHGTLDDQTIRLISERLTYLRNLDKRREEITNSITEQGKMTPELAEAISNAAALVELEDIYRPYKQKRRTRASIAKERVWSLWRSLSWLRTQRPNPLPKLRNTSARKRAYHLPTMLLQVPATLLRKQFQMTLT